VPGTVGTLLLFGALLLARPEPVPSAIVLLGGGYAGSLFLGHPRLDIAAPLVAGGLVLVAELTYLALELRPPVVAEPGVLFRRCALVCAVGLGSSAVSATVLGAGALPIGGSLMWQAIGVAAAVSAFAVLARLAREHTVRSP
jgi:hypothetical protein